MRVYRMRTYSGEEGEVIRWFARKADAIKAIDDHWPFGSCCVHSNHFDEEVTAVTIPDKKDALIDWLNANVRGKRLYD